MCQATSRKYVRLGKVPSDTKKPHTWRTRKDPFAEVWDEARALLEVNPGAEVKALFGELQRRHPGKFQQGQLRTLQRRVKQWKAIEGAPWRSAIARRGLLRPGVCPRGACAVRLHVPQRTGGNDAGGAVPASVVSLCAGIFQLRGRHGLQVGELRGTLGRPAACARALCRCAPAASFDELCGTQPEAQER